MEIPEVNYHLRSESTVTGGRDKGDTDVGLLVACKVQLSSEVIRWKTESFRLQKECDSAQQHSKELNQKVSKLLERTKYLEARLSQAEEERKHMKTASVMIESEKASCFRRLSQSMNKYHSIPATSNTMIQTTCRLFHHGIPCLQRHSEQKKEDWKDVSEKMLKQMQNKIKEHQNMCSGMSFHPGENVVDPTFLDSDGKEELEESVLTLRSNVDSLKHILLQQRKTLHFLIGKASQANFSSKRTYSSPQEYMGSPGTESLPSSKIKNEVFPDFNKLDFQTLHLIKGADNCNVNENLTHPCSCLTEPEANNLTEKQNPLLIPEERVCPMCQEQFDTNVPQADFEEHVYNHLEAESESLLEQYVLL